MTPIRYAAMFQQFNRVCSEDALLLQIEDKYHVYIKNSMSLYKLDAFALNLKMQAFGLFLIATAAKGQGFTYSEQVVQVTDGELVLPMYLEWHDELEPVHDAAVRILEGDTMLRDALTDVLRL